MTRRNHAYHAHQRKLRNLTKKEARRLEEVSTLARELMEKYHVQDMKFGFTYSNRFWGRCSYDKISLQLNHALRSSMEDIKNTLLHEIAHAILGPGHGHRIEWQLKAKEMGVTWTRNYHK